MRSGSTRSRSNVSSQEIVTGSCGSTTIGRSSIPCARRWSSSPTLPGSISASWPDRARRDRRSARSRRLAGAPAPSAPRRAAAAAAAVRGTRDRRPGGTITMPTGLAAVARDLRDGLRAAGAERAAEPGRLAHGRLERTEQRARRVVRHHRREIEVALVDADLLDARAELPDELPRPPASARGSARGRAARRPRAGSGAAPRPSSSPEPMPNARAS